MSKFAVILPAAGRSSRFHDSSYKKPFAPLANKAIWLHSAERFLGRSDVVQTILVIAPEDRADFIAIGCLESDGDFLLPLEERGGDGVLDVEKARGAAARDDLVADPLAIGQNVERALLPFIGAIGRDHRHWVGWFDRKIEREPIAAAPARPAQDSIR